MILRYDSPNVSMILLVSDSNPSGISTRLQDSRDVVFAERFDS